MRLVLASASPRRAELLRAAGFTFETLAVDVDEGIRPNESPSEYVRRLAAEKSARAMAAIAVTPELKLGPTAVSAGPADRLRQGYGGPPTLQRRRKLHATAEGGHDRHPDHVIVLGADTAVVVDGAILGKPRDDQDARAMLGRLSGRAHQVMTGISLRSGASEIGDVETTTVWLAPLSPEDIDWYVASGEGHDKAGAYAIQGRASRFIPRIDGSYSNVVGLPVARVSELLRRLGQA